MGSRRAAPSSRDPLSSPPVTDTLKSGVEVSRDPDVLAGLLRGLRRCRPISPARQGPPLGPAPTPPFTTQLGPVTVAPRARRLGLGVVPGCPPVHDVATRADAPVVVPRLP